MNGKGCGHDICAICLDPPTVGGLALACRHSFHAECLLASFSGETPGQWKCPCCRALVCTRADAPPKDKNNKASAFIKSSDGARDAEQALPGDFESLVFPPNMHYYIIEESKWGTLQAFLTAAACALAEQKTDRHQNMSFSSPVEITPLQPQQQHHICARSHDIRTSNFSPFSLSKKKTSKTITIAASTTRLSSPLINRCMAIAEKLCPPTASSITAFVGHAQLQRLLDPSLPHPFYRFLRYVLIVVLSIGAVVFGIWLLRVLMFAFGVAVCAASDATARVFGVVQMDTMCVPMIPETWALPIGFALVGLYISIQISVISGVTFRHVLLKWDEQAIYAIGVWFMVCLGYTVFVYFARYLLTVLVSCLVPFSGGQLDGCVPTVSNPCY